VENPLNVLNDSSALDVVWMGPYRKARIDSTQALSEDKAIPGRHLCEFYEGKTLQPEAKKLKAKRGYLVLRKPSLWIH